MISGKIERALLLAPDSDNSWGSEVSIYFANSLASYYQGVSENFFDSNGGHFVHSNASFEAFGDGERYAAISAFGNFEWFTQSKFKIGNSAAESDIVFGIIKPDLYADQNKTQKLNGFASWRGLHNSLRDGDVWLTGSRKLSGNPAHDNAVRKTIFHEIGHAMGLRHPHNVGIGTSSTDQNPENTGKFSIMSYQEHPETGAFATGYQLYDIAALQKLYGRNDVGGDSNYKYDFFIDRTFAQNDKRAAASFSIWDGGGNDTIDLSQSANDGSYIDLRPGYFSSIGPSSRVKITNGVVNDYGIENISIAFGAYIENARGGDKEDLLIGNVLTNKLEGGKGDDLIFASASAVAYANLIFGPTGINDVNIGDYRRIGRNGIEDPSDEVQDFLDNPEKQRDILIGGEGDDRLFGAEGDDILSGGGGTNLLAGGDGKDTVDYGADPTINGPLTLELGTAMEGNAKVVTLVGAFTDKLFDIESVKLTGGDDWVKITAPNTVLEFQMTIDGGLSGSGGDRLDFSVATSRVLIGKASDAPSAVELYAGVDSDITLLDWVKSLFNGAEIGLTGGTGLRFTNFEHVVGSAHGDIFGLWNLSPGGALTDAQRAAFDTARAGVAALRNTLGNPAGRVARIDALIATAAAGAPQLSQQVVIDAGAGNDVVIGTETGHNVIRGGVGDDRLYAGGFVSEVYGGDGNDHLYGNGLKSQLHGGQGVDVFHISDNSFVMDADTNDSVQWDGRGLTGAVQQWWMEGGWAYFSPLTALASALPQMGSGVFSAIAAKFETVLMPKIRYSLSDSGQLIIQMGRLGQAVVNNYHLDLQTGEATGGIVVVKQVLTRAGDVTRADFENYLNLILKAGFGTCIKGTDPLILDLDGDGLELTGRSEGSVYFDMDKDGFAERTAWVKGDDGLLARDLNGNGKIDDIGELFGNANTPGFSALATLDSNGDGRIDAADAGFATLRVWRDLDQDGVTDAGELKTLAEVGVASISLAAGTPTTGTIKGSTVRAEGTFTRTNGTTGKIADVLLDGNQTDSKYLGDSSVSAQAAALPTLKGYGNVTDLRVAMTKDPTLLTMVAAFKALPTATSWAELKDRADDIMFRWAGVSNVDATPIGGVFDTRRLAFLEAYFGYQLTPRGPNGVPSAVNASLLLDTWNDVIDKIAVRLAAQGPLAALLGGSYGLTGDRLFSGDVATLANAYKSVIASLPADPAAALAIWMTDRGPMLKAYRAALVRHDSGIL